MERPNLSVRGKALVVRVLILFVQKRSAGRNDPGERFLSNTGGAGVSTCTLEPRQFCRRNPRPRSQGIPEATGIGNSTQL